MKVTITPIAVGTIAPAILATAAAAILPFAQPAPALASTHVAAHHAVVTHTTSTKATAAHHATAAAHADSHATARHHQSQPAQASASDVSQQTQTGQEQAQQSQAQQSQAQQSQAQQSQAQQGQGSQALPTGMSSFEQCVAWRESTDTPTDPDGLFGILPSTWAQLGYSGTAGQASVAVQQQAFNKLYAEYGAQPWAPSDGC